MTTSSSALAWRHAYSAAALALTAMAWPVALLDGAFSAEKRAAWRERYGAAPRLAERAPAWFVAASVGEVRAAEPLLRLLSRERPEIPLVLSVLTAHGRSMARSLQPLLAAPPFHPPLDSGVFVRRALERLRPRAVLVVETEIWPSLFANCAGMQIPLALVNGRLSARSFPRYLRIRPLVQEAFASARVLAMRSAEDAERAMALGAPRERVVVAGDLKFDAAAHLALEAPSPGWVTEAGLDSGRWMAFASTAEGEEGCLLDAFAELLQEAGDLRLLLVPKRPERFDAVASLVRDRGLPLVRRSSLPGPPVPAGGVLLLDTTGELARLYRHAELVFVGGSLVPHGGQNLLEPAAAGKPVLFGPHVENFRAAEMALLSAGGGARVTSENLVSVASRLLRDDAERRTMGAAARAAVARNEGAACRTLELIGPLLDGAERTFAGGRR